MSSLAVRIAKLLRVPASAAPPSSSLVVGMQRSSKTWYSSRSHDDNNDERNINEVDDKFDDFLTGKPEMRVWILEEVGSIVACIGQLSVEKLKESPVQKIVRNGRTVTIFSVGTGGMFDQRIVGTCPVA